MSVRRGKILALAGENFANKTTKELESLFASTLKNGMHGIGFSPYLENQSPGDIITEDQIRRRMELIKPYVKWVRTFSCTDGNEHIPRIAREYGIKTLVGAWLGTDEKINAQEIRI
jgi:exo-beta-1,3-glucanase (GH17 family)